MNFVNMNLGGTSMTKGKNIIKKAVFDVYRDFIINEQFCLSSNNFFKYYI